MANEKTIVKVSLFTVCIFLVASFLSAANAQTSASPPLPTLRPYVNDLAGVLTPDDISSINALAAQIEQNTTVQIAVLTVNTTQPLTIDQYANQVFRANGIGHSDNNNGLLIVAAINDRHWRFEVGYGLEGDLPDALVGQIGLTYLVPNFQNGDYGKGLYDAVQSVGTILETGSDPSIISQDNSNSGVPVDTAGAFISFLPFIIFLSIPIILIVANDFSRCPKCGSWTRGHGDEDDKTRVDFVCKNGHKWTKKKKRGGLLPIFFGGGGWGGGGGGGGGFGGGSSGGGGAGGGW